MAILLYLYGPNLFNLPACASTDNISCSAFIDPTEPKRHGISLKLAPAAPSEYWDLIKKGTGCQLCELV